jgi:hypothetical protein
VASVKMTLPNGKKLVSTGDGAVETISSTSSGNTETFYSNWSNGYVLKIDNSTITKASLGVAVDYFVNGDNIVVTYVSSKYTNTILTYKKSGDTVTPESGIDYTRDVKTTIQIVNSTTGQQETQLFNGGKAISDGSLDHFQITYDANTSPSTLSFTSEGTVIIDNLQWKTINIDYLEGEVSVRLKLEWIAVFLEQDPYPLRGWDDHVAQAFRMVLDDLPATLGFKKALKSVEKLIKKDLKQDDGNSFKWTDLAFFEGLEHALNGDKIGYTTRRTKEFILELFDVKKYHPLSVKHGWESGNELLKDYPDLHL